MENKELYQSEVEQYLEDNHVYDTFEEMLKYLLAELPADPIEFLLEKLVDPPGKVLYLLGNDGKARREFIAEHLKNQKNHIVSMHEILNLHLEQKGKHSHEISSCMSINHYISDETILELLELELKTNPHKGKNLIFEGVPRTRVQALAIHSGGIIPSRILILHQKENTKHEDNYHIQGIKDVYPNLWHETHDISKLVELLSVKTHSDGPRKPPHVIILGAPGTGRTTQAQALSSKYHLSYVSPGSLLRDQIQRGTELASTISAYFSKGEYVPDSILTPLIINRLKETDCLLNGWVLDGFPKTLDNLIALRQNKITPTHVFFLECHDSLVYDRTEERRLDPLTGVFYNISNPPANIAIKNRLLLMPEDTHTMVKNRLQAYKDNTGILKKELSDVAFYIDAKDPISLVSEKIADAIENNKSLEFR